MPTATEQVIGAILIVVVLTGMFGYYAFIERRRARKKSAEGKAAPRAGVQ